MSRYRKRIPRRKSRRSFSKNAMRTHKKNNVRAVMRGGIRL